MLSKFKMWEIGGERNTINLNLKNFVHFIFLCLATWMIQKYVNIEQTTHEEKA